MSEYIPEFQTPVYSILGRRDEGNTIVTTVVMDGKVMEFVADRATVRAANELIGPTEAMDE